MLSRQEVIPLLRTVVVAPVTSTIHGAPSEVLVGVEEEIKTESAVNLDHVQTVEQARLRHFVDSLRPSKMAEACRESAVDMRPRHLGSSQLLAGQLDRRTRCQEADRGRAF